MPAPTSPAEPEITAICNGGIVIGSDGVLVVDPFQNEELANRLFTTVATLKGYLETLETLALEWKANGLSQENAIAQTEIPDAYADCLFQGLLSNALAAAYQQIPLGNDDAAAIQPYFPAQTPALRAL